MQVAEGGKGIEEDKTGTEPDEPDCYKNSVFNLVLFAIVLKMAKK